MASGKASDKTVDDAETIESGAVEETLESSTAQRHGFFARLYTGTGAFDVVGRRKVWFTVSGLIIAIAIASIAIRGFTFGIDFQGGTKMSFPRGDASVTQVEETFAQTTGKSAQSVVVVGNGSTSTVQIRSETVSYTHLTLPTTPYV